MVTKPTIIGPTKAKYGTQIELIATGSVATDPAVLQYYEWTLPDSSTYQGETVQYVTPDESHIGEVLTFKCVAHDSFGDISDVSTFNVIISNNTSPVIKNLIWSEDPPHYHTNSYTVTINAVDYDNDTLSYSVTCNDSNVVISQESDNVFTITYPEYLHETSVTFTFRVNDGKDVTTKPEEVLVRNNLAPFIRNIIWQGRNITDNNNRNLFDVTIEVDDDSPNLTCDVICDHSEVNIVKDSSQFNLFHIYIPKYSRTVNLVFTYLVSDGTYTTEYQRGLVVSSDIPPFISTIKWSGIFKDSYNHYIGHTYTAFLQVYDYDSDIISYNLTCDDSRVIISRDTNKPNLFKITYPMYDENTIVTFTFSVCDGTTTILKTYKVNVLVNRPPIIDSIIWDGSVGPNNEHYSDHEYRVVINAVDDDKLNYSLVCNNYGVRIEQDENKPNVFNVYYSEHVKDVDVTYTIQVSDGVWDPVTEVQTIHVLPNLPPKINDIIWEGVTSPNGNYYNTYTYTLIINAEDRENDPIIYKVTCSDSNVVIKQDDDELNKFYITYPDYEEDQTLYFTIMAGDGRKGTARYETVTVLADLPPVINSIAWDSGVYYGAHSYTVTIDANDPETENLTYIVEADDPAVNISQHKEHPNIFNITFPNYDFDTTVSFTFKVSDGVNVVQQIQSISVLKNLPPQINNIIWDGLTDSQNNHYGAHKYTVTIDATDREGDVISYDIFCNDVLIDINQIDENKFEIVYPNYKTQVDITFTFQLSDGISITEQTQTVTVIPNQPPQIDSIIWDGDIDSNGEHRKNKQYTVTINCSDSERDDLTYDVVCTDSGVVIERDSNVANKFYVTYPDYEFNMQILYIFSVSDGVDTVTETQEITVIANEPPVIENVYWEGDLGPQEEHYIHGEYEVTIEAADPDKTPKTTLMYSVSCSDLDVRITPGSAVNKFKIKYPEYTQNKIVTYTFEISDGTYIVSQTQDVNVFVNKPPEIVEIKWNSEVGQVDKHYASYSYTVTIIAKDIDNDDLTYNVTCDKDFVVIQQDTIKPNIFHIVYPDANSINSTTVTYVFTVSDGESLTAETQSFPLSCDSPPLISNIEWKGNVSQDGIHLGGHKYDAIINVIDVDTTNLEYFISYNDKNIIAQQDQHYKNIFHITYPDYAGSTDITYTFKISDGTSIVEKVVEVKVVPNQPPVINSVEWDGPVSYNGEHCIASYILKINASDPDNDILSASVTCSDSDVIIERGHDPGIFKVTYPKTYTDTVDLTYRIEVSDGVVSATRDCNVRVVPIEPPTINSITWEGPKGPGGEHYNLAYYTLTIDAVDPRGNPLSYEVICEDDSRILIDQDPDYPNIFSIHYPNYYKITDITYKITVANYLIKTIINEKITILVNHAPKIDSIEWYGPLGCNGEHCLSNYVLTIEASDPDNDNVFSNVTCSDSNVVIESTGHPGVFNVIYPEYEQETDVTYTIEVTDHIVTTTQSFNVCVLPKKPPTIDSVIWDGPVGPNGEHYNLAAYKLTINASDPNNKYLKYSVICKNDKKIQIKQDENNSNVFLIQYPNYYTPSEVTYEITVSNSEITARHKQNIKILVNHTPVIDSVEWVNEDIHITGIKHFSGKEYTLKVVAHDIDDDILHYSITCDDSRVYIEQDSEQPNLFKIAYPTISESTKTVAFTVTVRDMFLTATKTIHDTFARTVPAVINNIIFYNSTLGPNNEHYGGHVYACRIDYYSVKKNLNVKLVCNDPHVDINLVRRDKGIFTVSYPKYTEPQQIDFFAEISDSNTTVQKHYAAIVLPNTPPQIESVDFQGIRHQPDGYLFKNQTCIMTITVSDADGCTDSRDIINVTVDCTDPRVEIVNNTTNDNTATVDLTKSTDGTSSATFNVTFPDYSNDITVYPVTFDIHATDGIDEDWKNETVNIWTDYPPEVTNLDISPRVIEQDLSDNVSIITRIVDYVDDYNLWIIVHDREYTFTIEAVDPEGDPLTCNLECGNDSIQIVKQSDSEFTVSVPEFREPFITTFTFFIGDGREITKYEIYVAIFTDVPNFSKIDFSTVPPHSLLVNDYTITFHSECNMAFTPQYSLVDLTTNMSSIEQDSDNPNLFRIHYNNPGYDFKVSYVAQVVQAGTRVGTQIKCLDCWDVKVHELTGDNGYFYDAGHNVQFATISTHCVSKSWKVYPYPSFGAAISSNGSLGRGVIADGDADLTNYQSTTTDKFPKFRYFSLVADSGGVTEYPRLRCNTFQHAMASNGSGDKCIKIGGGINNRPTLTHDRSSSQGYYLTDIVLTISTGAFTDLFTTLGSLNYGVTAVSNGTNNCYAVFGGWAITYEEYTVTQDIDVFNPLDCVASGNVTHYEDVEVQQTREITSYNTTITIAQIDKHTSAICNCGSIELGYCRLGPAVSNGVNNRALIIGGTKMYAREVWDYPTETYFSIYSGSHFYKNTNAPKEFKGYETVRDVITKIEYFSFTTLDSLHDFASLNIKTFKAATSNGSGGKAVFLATTEIPENSNGIPVESIKTLYQIGFEMGSNAVEYGELESEISYMHGCATSNHIS